MIGLLFGRRRWITSARTSANCRSTVLCIQISVYSAGDSGRQGSEIGGGEGTAEEAPPAGRLTDETDYFPLADDSSTSPKGHVNGNIGMGRLSFSDTSA